MKVLAAPFSLAILSAAVDGFAGFGFGLVLMSLFAFCSLPMGRVCSALTIVSLPLLLSFALRDVSLVGLIFLRVLVLLIGMIVGTPLGYQIMLRYGNTAPSYLGFGLVSILVSL